MLHILDIIRKKRDGGTLTKDEIEYFVRGCTDGSIPDYQLSALLMAIYLNGMTHEETAELTLAMAHSGDMADLSAIHGVTVDKHSTGGVGDKTSMVIVPVCAACGVKIAKMSGRGLGHTGGTADKLESIPGMRIDLSPEEFTAQINKIGCAMIGQTGELCPADKKLYALRDVTGTVESVPLIASSIMSKKIASGAERILLDVKTGSGAFMKTTEDAITLAEEMVEIAKLSGRRAAALITDMDRPLGHAVGNTLEVLEVLETLHGRGPEDLTEECLELAANMIWLGEQAESLEHARKKAKTALETGKAFEKFCEMAEAQVGCAVLERTRAICAFDGEKRRVRAAQRVCGAYQRGAGGHGKRAARRRTREGRRYARLRRGHRAEKDGGRRGTKRRGDRRAVRCERRKMPRRGKRAARGVPLR